MTLSAFERKFITALAEGDRQRAVVLEQLQQVSVISRDYTGVGLYTQLSISADAPKLDEARWRIEDMPNVFGEHPDLAAGAGFILWIKDGYICCLEAYTFDGNWPADESLFRLAV